MGDIVINVFSTFLFVMVVVGYIDVTVSDQLEKMDQRLVGFWDERWHSYVMRVGKNVDPRLLEKRKHKMHTYKDNRLTKSQEWSFAWRRATRFLDPYVSLTDTQKWMLGVKKPYRPGMGNTRVLRHRKPMKKPYWSIFNEGISISERQIHYEIMAIQYDNMRRHTK